MFLSISDTLPLLWKGDKIIQKSKTGLNLCRHVGYFPIYLLLRTLIKYFFNLILFRIKVNFGILDLNADHL